MGSQPLSIFQVAGRAMSAQLVRMNTTASNLANAGAVTGSSETAYRSMKPVFRTQFDEASGMATVNVERVVTAGEEPIKIRDPNNAGELEVKKHQQQCQAAQKPAIQAPPSLASTLNASASAPSPTLSQAAGPSASSSGQYTQQHRQQQHQGERGGAPHKQ